MHEIDPELKYCPKCSDEYRADMITCAACNVELITGAEKLSLAAGVPQGKQVTPLSGEEELVAIQKGQLREMKNLKALLENHGVAALIAGEGGDCNKGCCGPEVLVHVRHDEAEEAMKVLANEFRRSTSLASYDLSGVDAVYDESAKEVTCPACGHSFIPTTSECPDCGLVIG